MSLILRAIESEIWLVRPETLELMVTIAHRQNDSIEAVEQKIGKKLENSQKATIRGNVAVIPICGPIMRYANLFTQCSGATSLECLATDFGAALENPIVNTIVLNIDSPGGQSNGISEFADMIKASKKPVIAYVGDMACSAAYWIACSCSRIVASKTAQVGSIGVIAAVQSAKNPTVIEIVSNVSPNKNPDINTSEGRSQIQARVDTLGKIFVESVAQFRGVTSDFVAHNFGAGDVLIGENALSIGMIDEIGSFESTINGNFVNPAYNQSSQKNNGDQKMAEEQKIDTFTAAEVATKCKEQYDLGFSAGKLAECQRIKGVEAQCIPGHEALIRSIKYDLSTTPEAAAMQVLAAEKQARSNHIVSLSQAPKPVKEPADRPDETSSLSIDDQCEIKFNKSKDLQDEFDSLAAYTAYIKAEQRGAVKRKRA